MVSVTLLSSPALHREVRVTHGTISTDVFHLFEC